MSAALPIPAVPELPEVETVRRGLDEHFVGRRIGAVTVGRPRTVRRTSPAAVIAGLSGATVLAANRRGKYLVCPLDTGDAVMIHLRMSGQLLLVAAGTAHPAHTHVVMPLDDGNEMLFVDPRTFGEVVVFDQDNVAAEVPELTTLGVDPLVDGVDAATFRDRFGHRSTRMKALLLDQHLIAGIGNIYADEILHACRIHPETPGTALRRKDFAALAEHTPAILEAAVKAGGSTLGDAQYVDLLGSDGWYQDEHTVYGRAGEHCVTCGRGVLRRLVHNGRSTVYCPRCQRLRSDPPRSPRAAADIPSRRPTSQ